MGLYDQTLSKSLQRRYDRAEYDSTIEEQINSDLGACVFGQGAADSRKRLQKSLREKELSARAARMPQQATPRNQTGDDALMKSLEALERLANGDPPPTHESDQEKIERLSRENGILKSMLARKKPKK